MIGTEINVVSGVSEMAEPILTQAPLQPSANDSWSITLRVTEGPHAGQTFSFAQHDTFLVGRSKQAHFCLPEKDPFFSRLHFLIEVNPPMCRLVDLKSHNGTTVNGQTVSSSDLQDGDEIRGGTTTLLVQIRSAALEELPATAPPQEACSVPVSTRTLHGFPTIPGYRICQELGRGAMGIVYQAQRESDRRDVALKTIIPKIRVRQDTIDRFLREANILSHLRHPHIVAFQDIGQTPDLIYFAMDLVVGTDANKLVKKEGPLPIGRATRLFLQVLDAMAYAHQKGIVHRDLKPGNILVAQEQGQDLAKVADFGLARTYQESPMSGLTMSGEIGGTPQYMPPEQVLHFRSVKPAGDQYAAAATLYFFLTGKPPFDAITNLQDFFKRILQEEPVRIDERRADVPKELADIIHRALAREPGQRFADVLALRQALGPFSR
jgi:pSer/pThr/pTyr-binding forkhead associated (FHA) protein